MQKNKSARDKIRAATVGNKTIVKSKIMTIEGVDIEIFAPTLEQSQFIESKIEADEKDFTPRLLWTLIVLCKVPGTNERIFEEADYDTLMKKPAEGFIEKLYLGIRSLSTMDVVEEKKS